MLDAEFLHLLICLQPFRIMFSFLTYFLNALFSILTYKIIETYFRNRNNKKLKKPMTTQEIIDTIAVLRSCLIVDSLGLPDTIYNKTICEKILVYVNKLPA